MRIQDIFDPARWQPQRVIKSALYLPKFRDLVPGYLKLLSFDFGYFDGPPLSALATDERGQTPANPWLMWTVAAVAQDLTFPIVELSQAGGAGTNFFVIAGNWTAQFAAGGTFTVAGSTGNNGAYTVAPAGPTLSGGHTRIPVVQAIPSAVVDGIISLPANSGSGLFRLQVYHTHAGEQRILYNKHPINQNVCGAAVDPSNTQPSIFYLKSPYLVGAGDDLLVEVKSLSTNPAQIEVTLYGTELSTMQA